MASYFGDRTLTREQLDAAIAMLRDERTAHPVSLRQRQLFRFYRWAIWALCGSFVALIVPLANISDNSNYELGWLATLTLVFLALSLFASIAMFALNLKLIVLTTREMVIAVRSRLWRLTKPSTRRPTWLRRTLLIPKTYGWLLLAGALVGAFMSGWLGVLVAVVLAAYFFLWFVRRRLARLDDTDRLVQSLAGLQTDGGELTRVSVPDEVFQKVAQIEEHHLERKRIEALAELDTSEAGCAVVRSRRLVEQMREIAPIDRLRIEHFIADLADAPAPPGAPTVATIAVPDTGRSITFRRDAEWSRIEVLELSDSGRNRPVEEVVRG